MVLFIAMRLLSIIISGILIIAHTITGAFASILIGEEGIYTVEKGDTLGLIASKLGVEKKTLINDNQLEPKVILQPGTKLKVNTRKIVPKIVNDGIIINIPDRMLYFFKDGVLDSYYPLCLGMPVTQHGLYNIEWKTPEGRFKVTGKEKDPVWRVPKSIQLEMELNNKTVEEVVPPGKGNPLGRYAIRTSIPAFLIHETIWPTSIYRYSSHGCARMLPKHMEIFYPKVNKDIEGEIIYKPVKIAFIDNKKIYLEVHRDIYRKIKNFDDEALKEIERSGLSDKIDWEKAKRVISEKKGVAEDITDEEKIKIALQSKSIIGRISNYIKTLFNRDKTNKMYMQQRM
ncbi:MAG: L,D-transpeptidase family protein [Syntrophorhabdaceae bacterium]|nr:L,D-transpeptidase family protein [Syntrophorhabdaceae bacterium]